MHPHFDLVLRLQVDHILNHGYFDGDLAPQLDGLVDDLAVVRELFHLGKPERKTICLTLPR